MQFGIVSGALRSQFSSRTEAEIFRHFQREQREQRKRNNRDDGIEDDAIELLDMAMLIVTEAEVRRLRLELDRYDAATIEALYQNEAELALVREKLHRMLAEAHVLPDGRRVFKTEDGTRVFDEHGEEVDAETIYPDEIGDDKPTWESYKLLKEERDALERQRQELLAYQEKLDAARERLDAGDMTREEYERLREELTGQMPDAVRARIPELADETPEAPAPAQETALTFEDDMVPTYTPPGVAPGFMG